MKTDKVEKYLNDYQFEKKSYRELSANSKKISLILSDKCEAYDFDEIAEYIFPKNKPTSADAILLKKSNIIFIEFKGGLQRNISMNTFDREKCRCEKIDDICEAYAKVLKSNLKNIERELKSNLFQKAVESRWILDKHLLAEVYKDDDCPELSVCYVVVADKIKDNPLDAMEQIMDECANVYRENNFYEKMDASVKRLFGESRFGKRAFYDRVEVCSVQEFEQRIS